MRRDYSRIHLDATQIAAGDYKNHLGGKANAWQRRGEFQLELLKSLGLRIQDRLLDVGCGPIRGGVHFIRHLEVGGYAGVDFNPSFIEAAKGIVEEAGLASRAPSVSVIEDFDFGCLERTFDWVLCFSVLNHCIEDDRRTFFERIRHVMHADSRLVVTHGGWFDAACLDGTGLALQRTIEGESELPPRLAFADWGFGEAGDRLPILEFALKYPPRERGAFNGA
jgi:SAM-dependent methyltransferase